MAVDATAQEYAASLANGWRALAVDSDAAAIHWFGRGLEQATRERAAAGRAQALLYLGIASYGTSVTRGYQYALQALKAYHSLEATAPHVAREGRARCLQLVSTLQTRQGRFDAALQTAYEARLGLPRRGDTTGTLGLVYTNLARLHRRAGRPDSANLYLRRALEEQQLAGDSLYLPGTYVALAEQEAAAGRAAQAAASYDTAWRLATRTANRQAQASVLLSRGQGRKAAGALAGAEADFAAAQAVAAGLADKHFAIRAASALRDLKGAQGDYKAAYALQQRVLALQDTAAAADKAALAESLEAQFQVAEQGRALHLLRQDREIARLTASLLWGLVAVLVVGGGTVLFALRKDARKNRQLVRQQASLLEAEAALRAAVENEHRLAAQHLQADIEHKERQLSALTLQMLQKNELLVALREQLAEDDPAVRKRALQRLIHRSQNQDKEWDDFNTYFEGINKDFYQRLKEVYTDISPNDLKLCALIRLNLSTKEMAGVLNISPDSVKTARYRLRKKLGLVTEDNLTGFILNV